LVDLKWYRTELPFLPGESIINSRDWDSEPYLELPVGEVPKWSDPRTYNGAWDRLPGANGAHICHPEWFPTGEPWPVTLPVTDYTPAGVPLCCCVAEYDIHADQVWRCNAVPPDPCLRWSHIEPGPGNDWLIVAPGFPGFTDWFVFRTGPIIGQIVRFRLAGNLWNGRGVSPPIPYFSGTPIPGVPAVTVKEVL